MKEKNDLDVKSTTINSELDIDEKFDIKTMDNVLNIDFSDDEQILDIDTAFDFVDISKQKKKETKEVIEKREADNIIMEFSNKFLDENFVKDYNKEHDNLRNFLKKYKIGSDIVNNMTEVDKNKIYGIAEYLFNQYQTKLNKLMFKFYLNENEKYFLLELLKTKIEYDQNEIFQMKEIMDRYLNILEKTKFEIDEFDKDNNIKICKSMINVNDIIILYHLISKYKVKGVNSNFYSFLSLLTKIGERIKLFNAYNIWVQRLSDDFQLWGSSLTIDEDLIKPSVVENEKGDVD